MTMIDHVLGVLGRTCLLRWNWKRSIVRHVFIRHNQSSGDFNDDTALRLFLYLLQMDFKTRSCDL